MTIEIEITSVREFGTGNWQRPIFIAVDCTCTIDGEVFTAPWHVCIDEITRRFPAVEFTTSWVGRVCTLTPTGVQLFEIDPECAIFAREV